MKELVILLIAAVLVAFSACQRQNEEESSAPKSNILRDYIRTPIDKAKAVDKAAQDRGKQLDKIAAEVEEEAEHH